MPILPQMALPRPVLIAILGVALLLAALLATRAFSAGEDSGPVTEAPVEQSPSPAPERPEPNRSEPTPPREEQPSKPTKPAPEPPAGEDPGAAAGLPLEVAAALGADKVVVIVFTQDRSADDAGVRDAVRGLKRQIPSRRVEIFDDTITNIADYRLVVSALGVSQTPSVVVLRGDRPPRLLEGFIDEGSLRQYVADALR